MKKPFRSHGPRRVQQWILGCAAGVVCLLIVAATAAQGSQSSAATVLHGQGVALFDEGDFAGAAEKLAESQRLDPGIGTALRLAAVYEKLGRSASAWASLKDASELAVRKDDTERQKVADTLLAELTPRLMRLRVVVAPVARVDGLEIKRNGVPVGEAQWGDALSFDPGNYVLQATAPGRDSWSTTITLDTEGETREVLIPVLPPESPPSPSVAPPTAPSVAPPAKDAAIATDLSHAWQVGAVIRADIDPKLRGFATEVGVSFGLGSYLEAAGGVVLGKNSGFFVEMKGYFLRGAWKPLVLAGVDSLVVDGGAYPGLHGAAGLQWDPIKHFGIMAAVGVLWYPNVPRVAEGEPKYESLYFVPSIGVQGRL